jgi:hypothetical protein
MKLLAVASSIVCFPVVGRDMSTDREQRLAVALRAIDRRAQHLIMERAVTLQETSWLSDTFLGAIGITATGFKDDGGDTFTLTGVEVKTSNVIVTADEVIYDRTAHRIEPRGQRAFKLPVLAM